ncbi:hypothetical protein Vadar_004015 [Vaccinium darrowii]|uniref:Uncharacterized protein n=1 Tax=Vaccinium darrowii TaxID=229202 RepID=A0ACB7XN66_9ERIC|nr:hypothetical protein Vadar_004015 [Vaccinium darrowii]
MMVEAVGRFAAAVAGGSFAAAMVECAVGSLGTRIKSSNTPAKSSNTSAKSTSVNPPTQKPAAYRPPHAKTAEAIQAELFGRGPTQEMSKNALKNMKKREKQKEKKAAEAATSGS